MSSSSSAQPVQEIRQRIQSLGAEIARAEAEKSGLEREIRDLKRKLIEQQVHRFFGSSVLLPARWCRRNPELYLIAQWVVPAVVGGMGFVASYALRGNFSVAIFIAIPMTALAFGFLFALRFVQLDSLEGRVARQAENAQSTKALLKSRQHQVDSLQRALHSRKQELAQARSSILFRQSELLKVPWRELRSVELENYLEQVLTTLGAGVETTKVSGDQGVDLIAIYGDLRIAIQVKGYVGSVGNSAVQEVVAGSKLYGCRACAVITNSRFTPAAVELANAHNCTLIDEFNFEKFVLGTVPL